MKETTVSKIQWYEPSDNRRRPTATLKKNGVLCFGMQMRENLSDKIRIGFDFEKNTIIVEPNPEQGFKLTKTGEVKLYDIAIELLRQEIKLPAIFLFFYESKDSYWKGHIIPSASAKRLEGQALLENRTSIFIAYKWLINTLVYTHAKTTPIDERRSIASAALWEAICSYTKMHGSLKEHLLKEIKATLDKQNSHYVKHYPYSHLSLDAPAYKNDTASTLICELPLHHYKDEMADIENKIYIDSFIQTSLNAHDRKILTMLMDGYTEIEILDKLNITKSEFHDCCKNLGNSWELFKQDSAS